jgi:hypothetical protein
MPAKFTAAATSSRPASGQTDWRCVTMTSSMICRWTSGIVAVASVAASVPPSAMTTLRRCRQL